MDSCLDVSDHKPLVVYLNCDKLIKVDHEEIAKKFHKFNWKDKNFQKLFKEKVKLELNNNIDDTGYTIAQRVDYNIKRVTSVLIKCARNAEIEINKKRSTHKNKNLRDEINYVNILRKEAKLANVYGTYKKIQYKQAKKELRRKQRRGFFSKENKTASRLENLMYYNKDKFWNSIKSFRKKPKELANSITLDEFAEYYSSLFSHKIGKIT